MAVERPEPRIVRVELYLQSRLRRHENGVADGSPNRLAIDLHDFEHVPVQMHGMRHHRGVAKDDLDPLAAVDRPRQPTHPIDGHAPYPTTHAATQDTGK